MITPSCKKILITGACERSIACSTCNVILDPEVYDKLPEPEDEENDMLDLAFALEDTYVSLFPVLLPTRSTSSPTGIADAVRWTKSIDFPTSICARIVLMADPDSAVRYF